MRGAISKLRKLTNCTEHIYFFTERFSCEERDFCLGRDYGSTSSVERKYYWNMAESADSSDCATDLSFSCSISDIETNATDKEVDAVSDGGIEPYQFEPVASNSPEESEDDNPESPDGERLHNTNW